MVRPSKRLANILRNERIRAGYTVAELAKKIEVSEATLWRFEQGVHISCKMIDKYCIIFNVSLALIDKID